MVCSESRYKFAVIRITNFDSMVLDEIYLWDSNFEPSSIFLSNEVSLVFIGGFNTETKYLELCIPTVSDVSSGTNPLVHILSSPSANLQYFKPTMFSDSVFNNEL
jgi:hypothetical protein